MLTGMGKILNMAFERNVERLWQKILTLRVCVFRKNIIWRISAQNYARFAEWLTEAINFPLTAEDNMEKPLCCTRWLHD